MKQTAVEWLAEALAMAYKIEEISIRNFTIKKLIEQAKEMEKQQIIESYCQGCFDIIQDENIFPRETSEQYYNETFKPE